jgi:predicted aldo/keto reductase-like oxidoreductase
LAEKQDNERRRAHPRLPDDARLAIEPSIYTGPMLASPQRREFLTQGAAAALSLGALTLGASPAKGAADPAAAQSAPEAGGNDSETSGEARVRRHVKLGKTGLLVPDISFGTGVLVDGELVAEALRRGITYFDTAESYPVGGRPGTSERILGAALEGRRDDVVLATKTVAGPGDDRGTLMRRLGRSLRRLRTDHVDIYFNHAVNDLPRLKNHEWFEFVERAKRQGKIRFSGMSGHGGNLIECLDYALDENLVDVILAAHNFGQDPAFYERFTRSFDLVANQVDLPRVLAKAHAKGVGVLTMKTLMGARLNDMRPYEADGRTFSQAAFRWVLSNPNVDGLVVTMKSRKEIAEYLAASGGERVDASDLSLLWRYAALNGAAYCQHGCGACLSSCSRGIAIPELLRTRMYATDYQDLDLARGSLEELTGDLSSCLSCTDRTCIGACPLGIDISGRIRSLPQILDAAPRSVG